MPLLCRLDNLAAMTAHLYKMLSIAEANESVQSSISMLESIDANLLAATGYVLAEEIKAKEPLPPFPASIKVFGSFHCAPNLIANTDTIVGEANAAQNKPSTGT